MISLIQNVIGWLREFSVSDWILFLTFLAIIWYSWETRKLREWQKRNLQMSILDLAVRIKIAGQESLRAGHGQTAYVTKNFPETLRKIYEEGRLDLQDFYVMRPKDKKWKKVKRFFVDFYNKFKGVS